MSTRKTFIVFSAIVVVLLLSSGGVYRKTASYFHALSEIKAYPAIPFEEFPMHFGPWQGYPLTISETVLKVAANDDYLSRVYVDQNRRLQASVYVAYTAEPRRMLGHRPRVCYTGGGWIHDGTQEDTIVTTGQREIPVLIHQFHRPGLDYQQVTVVNYYVVNGTVTSDHTSFSGLRFRRPKVTNGRAAYVAQVQISSSSETAAKILAQELSDEFFRYLPEAP